MNDNYQKEYQHLVYDAQQITKKIADLLERMEDAEEGQRFHKQDPHGDLFRKQHDILEQLQKVNEKYFAH